MFIIRCPRCGYKVLTNGTKSDLKDKGMLDKEIKKGCKTCGGPRKFKCIKCGNSIKMIRLRNTG